ncbi:MAG: ATP-dependent Clp protease proteolytic subunit, partial [Synergistaceae bacterium]|nr:ATP-dependent Clp protease proteolytic subunit [Synergistaceae bacterium]
MLAGFRLGIRSRGLTLIFRRITANSLMMIHNPSVGLSGYFDEIDIDKVKNSLSAVKSTLIQTYQTRTGKSESE